jgi:hypothetical protein
MSSRPPPDILVFRRRSIARWNQWNISLLAVINNINSNTLGQGRIAEDIPRPYDNPIRRGTGDVLRNRCRENSNNSVERPQGVFFTHLLPGSQEIRLHLAGTIP